ncbi:MAG TPA: copper resistance CopC family protein [Ureibacillus sp.]|nr:copper resistance CopC family protein [Ureibacillus sp.]
MKKIFISTLFLVFMFASTTFAHSSLTASNPTDGQIVEGNLTEITLKFDTGIESTSLITLTTESGEEIPVDISVNNDTLKAKISTELENGTYQVNWNIIGEDGHPINGSYLFLVNKSEEAEAASQADGVAGSSFNWVMIIVGAVVIILILSMLMKQPNKRRRRY